MKKHYYRELNQIQGIGYGGTQGPNRNPELTSANSLEDLTLGFQQELKSSYTKPAQPKNRLSLRLENILKSVSNYVNPHQLRIYHETLDADSEMQKIAIDSERLAIEQKKLVMDAAFSCAMRALS